MPRSQAPRILFVLTATALTFGAVDGTADGQGSAPPAPIDFSTLQHIKEGDVTAIAVEKAAKVLPRANQTDWMRLERTFFIHFGPNTFRGVEWGTGREDPSVFNPSNLDADQWVRTVKEGGGKMVILVCKHHDGFSLWPTRYSTHSVAASPWRGGKGNLVREVAEAARKYNIRLGVYLSPADLYQLRTNPTHPEGYYGNESMKLTSTIPTEPASFQSDPAHSRATPQGFAKFSYKVDDYNRYFLNELYELLTEYGRIDEVWFDGANPDPSVHETYDYNAWYDMIRHLQPHAIIFGKGPDGRWVGNEGGLGRTTEWSVIPLPVPPDQFRWPDMTDKDLGSRSRLVPGSYLWWYPAETNVPILHGWFWAEGKSARTGSELVDIYYKSVGRNSNWLLNLSPDKRGQIPNLQVANVRSMNRIISATFATNLAEGAKLVADTNLAGHAPEAAFDQNLDTWWEAAPGHNLAVLTLTLPHVSTFDVVSLQEAVDHRSQRIENFSLEAKVNGAWKLLEEQTTVGHKRLLRLAAPVTADQLRIRITGSRAEPTLAEIGVFKQAEIVQAPVISERDPAGNVAITSRDKYPIVYTIDGSTPNAHSSVYREPLSLPGGGNVLAASLTPDGQLGMLAVKDMPGLAAAGWRVISSSSQTSEHPAAAAIDGKAETFWQTAADASAPSQITVDTGSVHRVNGLTYLPRQDEGERSGDVYRFQFETSLDGTHWSSAIASGRFDNVFNNPELQVVHFPEINARYFRFTALDEQHGQGPVSVSELSLTAARSSKSAK